METLIKTNEEAREAVLSGINKATNIVASTYGPNGKQVCYQEDGGYKITNDGLEAIRHIHVDNRFEQMAVDILKDVAETIDKRVGGGRTTSVILAQALANSVRDGDMDTVRALEKEKDIVVAEIRKRSKNVSDSDTVKRIATFASESEKIGGIVSDAFESVGENGLVRSEEGFGNDIELEKSNGFEIPVGLSVPVMATNDEKGIAEHKDVKILVADYDINTMQELIPFVERLSADKITNIVVFAKSISKEVKNIIALNKLRGAFVFQHVELGKLFSCDEYIDDIATLTGATVIHESAKSLADVEVSELGFAKYVEISGDSTIIKNDRDVSKQIAILKKKDGSEHRVARLSDGIAVIKVGAQTESERKYLVKKVADAVAEARASIKGGVVKGAGKTLKEIADTCDVPLLRSALCSPYEHIGVDTDDILDPTDVVVASVEASISVVKTLLTVNTLLLEKEGDK